MSDQIFISIVQFIIQQNRNISASGYQTISNDNIFLEQTNYNNQVFDTFDQEINIETELLQEIVGFGAAFTQSAALNYRRLSPERKQEFQKSQFSKEGSKYSMVRLPIGSTDFSPQTYCYDEQIDDFNMDHFDTYLSDDETMGMIDMVRDTKATMDAEGRDLKLFGTVWSPPGWMKVNDSMINSNKSCLKTDRKFKDALALYIIKQLQSFSAKINLDFWAISQQNEPFMYGGWQFERCSYTVEDYQEFIETYLGPLLEKTQTNPPKIIAVDDSKEYLKWTIEQQKRHPHLKAWEQVQAFGTHWQTGPQPEILEMNTKSINKPILGTESNWFIYKGLKADDPWNDNNFNVDWRQYEDITVNFNQGGVGYMDWTILSDSNGDSGYGGPTHTNIWALSTTHVNPNLTLRYTSIQQIIKLFSENIDQGDKQINFTQTSRYGLETMLGCAFYKVDGRQLIILVNKNQFDINIKINLLDGNSFVRLHARSQNAIQLTISDTRKNE